MALGTGCEVGVGGTLQVTSCRKGTAWLRREEGGVPLWGSGESGGLRGVGTPPGWREKPRTGVAGGTGSPAEGNEWRGPRGWRCPGTELRGRAAVLASLLAAAAGKPAASRTALSPRVPARHPGRRGSVPAAALSTALPPQPAARSRSFPAGYGRGGRRSPRGAGRRPSPRPTQTARLSGCEQLISKRCRRAKLRRSGRPRPRSLPSSAAAHIAAPAEPPRSAPLGSARKSPPSLSAPASHDLPQPAPPFVLIFGNEILLPSPFPPPSHAFVWEMPRIAHQLLLSPPTSIFTPIYALVNSRSAAPPPRTYPATTCKHLAC